MRGDGGLCGVMSLWRRGNFGSAIDLCKFKSIIYIEKCEFRPLFYIEKCKSCFAFPFCGSGCPLKNSSDEYSYASNWECNEIKKYWEIVLNHLVENEKYIGWELEKLNIDTSDEFSIYKIKRSDNYENYN